MQLTMSGEVFSHAVSLAKALEITKSFEINFFELWPNNCDTLSTSDNQMSYKNRDIQKARQHFKDASIEVACVAYGGAFNPKLVANEKVYVLEFIRAIEVAAELGAKYVNHYCCNISLGFELDFDVLDRYYTQPLRRAESLGVTLVLENEAHDMTHTPENVLSIVRHFQSNNFRSNLDATNFFQAGNEAFPHAYNVLRDVVAYVHIKNGCVHNPEFNPPKAWKGGAMTGCWSGKYIQYTLPTSGAVNITGLLDKLIEDRYEGFVTLEPHSTYENVIDYYQVAIPLLRAAGYF